MSVREAFLGCVWERQGTPRPLIPEPWRLIGHPLWLLERRRWSHQVAWAAPPPSLSLTGESKPLSQACEEILCLRVDGVPGPLLVNFLSIQRNPLAMEEKAHDHHRDPPRPSYHP